MKTITQNLRWLLLCLLVGVGNVAWAVTGSIYFGKSSTTTTTVIDDATVTGDDNLGNTWTITTEGTTSFTNNNNSGYSQVGSKEKPAQRITFTTTLSTTQTITSFSAKFGGFSDTTGDITLKIGDTVVGSGSLNGSNDVIVSSSQAAEGIVLTVTITGISRGVVCYYISYSYGGGGDVPIPTETSSFNLATNSYQPNPSTNLITWSNEVFTMTNERNNSQTSVINYIPTNYNSTRFYKDHLLTITPASSYKINKVTFTATSDNYASALNNSSWTNASASVSGTIVIITPTDGTFAIQALISAACGFTKVEVEYEEATPKTPTTVTINATGIHTDLANGNNLGQLLATVLANGEAISDATVNWSSEDESVATVDENGNLTALKVGTTTITATYVGNSTYASSSDTYDLTVTNSTPTPSINYTFQKITSTSELVAGCEYVIVYEGSSLAISNCNNQYFENTSITLNVNTFEANENVNVLTLGGEEGAWTFATSLEPGKYLGLTSSENHLESIANPKDYGTWSITFDEYGNASIKSKKFTNRYIMYNNNQPRFACYTGTQKKVQLYKKKIVSETINISNVGWATYVTKNALDFSGKDDVKAYIIESVCIFRDRHQIGLTEVSKVPAETAILINKTRTENSYEIPVISDFELEEDNAPFSDNALQASDGSSVVGDGTIYVLNQVNGLVGFYPLNNGKTLSAGKAYLIISSDSSDSEAKYFFSFGNEIVDSINKMGAEESLGVLYNLNGQRVAAPLKGGIYIMNGKKVFIK